MLNCAKQLEELLLGDRSRLKQVLRTHLNPLVLVPMQAREGPVFEAQGELDLLGGLTDVMLLASRCGSKRWKGR